MPDTRDELDIARTNIVCPYGLSAQNSPDFNRPGRHVHEVHF